MSKPKIVLFDIDYTLFDLAKFKEKIFISIINTAGKKEQKGIKKNLEEIYDESKREIGYFKIDAFLNAVGQKLKLDIPSDIFKNGIFSNSLYEETKGILKLISKNGSILIGIFSGGELNFQLKKIEQIKSFFSKDHIHIIKYKHLNVFKIIKKYKNFKIYLVDDMLNILYNAKKADKNIITVWIKRGWFAKNAKPIKEFKPDFEIRDLKELVSIIHNS